ncbi:MAG: glycosyltransferase family 4 protein [Gammaproteobacteria bacterium]|nr:glycosyltransferase family 4 protein [Gammaproteobacteria bacterium]
MISVGQRLKEMGVETILCIPDLGGNVQSLAESAHLSVKRLDFQKIPKPRQLLSVLRWLFFLPGDIFRFWSLFKRENPALVHVNGAFFLAPAIASKIARVPLVWHLNDTIISGKLAKLFGFMVSRLANRVIVAAEAVGRHYGITPNVSTVIHAPVDLSNYPSGSVSGVPCCFEGVKKEAASIDIALVANWNPVKGIDYFVEAIAQVREKMPEQNIVIHFAGQKLATHQLYAEEIEAKIKQFQLQDCIHYHGFLENVSLLHHCMDIVVLSSTSEASPMTVLEAMAAGKPVVATDVGGVREMLSFDDEHIAGIIVPSKNSEALAEGLIELIQSSEKRLQLGQNGRYCIEKEFSLEKCTEKHYKLYLSLMEDVDHYCG